MLISGIYRGWVGPVADGKGVFMTGEGLILPRIERDVDRFGRDVRLRVFAAAEEFPLEQARDVPWKDDRYLPLEPGLRVNGVSVPELLEKQSGKFVHLEIEWRLP